MTFRLYWFLLETDRLALSVKFDHPVAPRVADLISENAGTPVNGESGAVKIEFSVENIIAENKRRARVADEFCADQKSLGDPLRLRLFGIFDSNPKLATIAQIIAKHRQILRCGNDQDLASTADVEGGERIATGRLLVDRKQVLADNLGQ